MKKGLYDYLNANGLVGRRDVLKGLTAATATVALGGVSTGISAIPAFAADNAALRKEILKIPGVGTGTPHESDWQKVGELTLEPTKQVIKEGEFKGVELTFMGLSNEGHHNPLFRGFLKSWMEYTGATVKWIDLAQADYNARLQQSIATGTMDFDVFEMGAPLEGDVLSRGLAAEVPDWVKQMIDMDDYVDYLKAPVGTWDGKTYRISTDGDCHTINFRKDYYANEDFAAAWAKEGDGSKWSAPKTWDAVQKHSKFLHGKKDPLTGLDAYGYLDPLKQFGGFGFYFLMSRASAYAKYPGNPAWLFEADTMKPMVNNPAFVQAIQDVMDNMPYQPTDQINADPNTTAFLQFLAGTGGMVTWWGDVGSNARTSDSSIIGDVIDFDILPASDRVYNPETKAWEDKRNEAPTMAYIGWGLYVASRVNQDPKKAKAAWSLVSHVAGKDLSLWCVAYPSGFQPYRKSHFNYDEWVEAGYDRAFVESYLSSNSKSYAHKNAAIEPRIPGIFQYYSIAEDELAKGFAGQYPTAQATADAIAAAWEKITDQIGRESQIKLYKRALGV